MQVIDGIIADLGTTEPLVTIGCVKVCTYTPGSAITADLHNIWSATPTLS